MITIVRDTQEGFSVCCFCIAALPDQYFVGFPGKLNKLFFFYLHRGHLIYLLMARQGVVANLDECVAGLFFCFFPFY